MIARSPLIPGIFLAIFLVSCQGHQSTAQFPVQNALEKGQAEVYPGRFYPNFDAPPVLHRSLNPLIADEADELIPIPDKVQHVSGDIDFVAPYRRLLALKPRDFVRSQIFDPSEFNKIKKITVEPFQNKTTGPNQDANAGIIVTSQVYQELRNSRNYTVVDPFPTEDMLLETVGETTGPQPVAKMEADLTGQSPDTAQEVASPGSEAIMTGAVTKFVDTYVDRQGRRQEGIASGIAFAAYLVTPEGKVIWGARFIGSQRQNFRDFIKYKGQWLNKEEFSRTAMKDVLKDFHNSRSSTE